MPQLNMTPWFMVFLLTWFALLIYGTKTTKLKEPQPPATQKMNNNKPAHWQWP